MSSPIALVVLSAVLVFALLVAYVFVDSSIRSREQRLVRAPLEKCLSDVDSQSLEDIRDFAQTAMNSLDPTWQAECESRRAEGAPISAGFCKPWSKASIDAGYVSIEEKTKAAKDECYRRYK
jgi:hypothetical protein